MRSSRASRRLTANVAASHTMFSSKPLGVITSAALPRRCSHSSEVMALTVVKQSQLLAAAASMECLALTPEAVRNIVGIERTHVAVEVHAVAGYASSQYGGMGGEHGGYRRIVTVQVEHAARGPPLPEMGPPPYLPGDG